MSYTCGTGSWSGPLPGDPSTNSILTATPVFGGIDITWTPAIVNPHAVIHTYLYRSTNPDFLTAVRIATVGGTHFYDKLENILTYYYWIQVVSINGTVGEVIGPASAIPRLSIDATIEALTGRIDNGVLAQSLKSEIDRISLIDGDLFQEIQDRIAANELLGAAIQTAQTDASQAVSLLNEEITQRTTAYNVLLQTLNTMAGQVNDNKAAIETESTLRISNDEALAQQITNVQSAAEDNLAAVQTTLQTNINTVNGKVTDIGALYTAKVQVNGLIGGFGVYNDGTEVQAGFDLDTFWVGRTGSDKKKPFIIDSDTGETYIDKAVIPTLTADMIDTKGLSIKDMNGDVILSAGTALDWSRIGGTNKPEDGATVGANASNLKAGVGVNMVFNGDYTDGLAGTTVGWRDGGNQHTLGWNLPNYTVQGEGTAYIFQPGTNGTAVFFANIWNGKEGQYFAVTPGQRYEFYAYLNTHRCTGNVILAFIDAAGNWLWAPFGTDVSHESTISSIGDMRMSHIFAVAPANAVKALLIVRGAGINSYDPYVFFSRVYFGEAGAGQTEPSLWSPGRGISQITSSNVTTYIDNAALGNAQIGGNLWSTNWNYADGTGWLLDRSGDFYGNNIYARGDIEASSLKAGVAMVDALNIKGSAMIVPIFISHGNASWDMPYSQGTWQAMEVWKYTLTTGTAGTFRFSFGGLWSITHWTGHANWPTGTVDKQIQILVNGSVVETVAQDATYSGTISGFNIGDRFYTLGAGTHTISVYMRALMADGGARFSRTAGSTTIQSHSQGASSI